jgi:tetratricopeptide (TPR) repeat protein
MNKTSILPFLILVFSFGCSHSQTNAGANSINYEAIKLNDMALKLYFNAMSFDKVTREKTLKKVINLLNEAITIDSNYYSLYKSKMAFQDELRLRDSAFFTAKLIVKKYPNDESTKIMLGRYYELKGDTISAFLLYKNSLSGINSALYDIGTKPDTANVHYNKYKSEELKKAEVLILLNRSEEARSILKDYLEKDTNEGIKRYLNRLLNMNRHDCLLYLRPTIGF